MRKARGGMARVTVIGVALTLVAGPGWGKDVSLPASDMSDLNKIRGVVKSSAEAVLSSQIQGRILRLPYKEGQHFPKGTTLVLLDCAKYRAELSGARAEHEARKKTLRNTLGLLQLNAVGSLEVEVAKAEAQKSLASMRIARVNVRGCRIRAPFSGRVAKAMVNEHENVFPNDPLLSILDDTRLEIELILASKSLSWLRRGTKFEFVVDETGLSHAAKVHEIGANVDPVSQTIKVIGVFATPPANVLAGMSGTAIFPDEVR